MNTLQRIMCGLLLVALAGCASMRSNKPIVTLSPNGSDIVYNGELDCKRNRTSPDYLRASYC